MMDMPTAEDLPAQEAVAEWADRCMSHAATVLRIFPGRPRDSGVTAAYPTSPASPWRSCTLRTAAALASILDRQAQRLIPDSDVYDGELTNFELPVAGWSQSARWMERMQRCFTRMRDDILVHGQDPRPACLGDAVALWTAVMAVDAQLSIGFDADIAAGFDQGQHLLPTHPDDFDWDEMFDETLSKDLMDTLDLIVTGAGESPDPATWFDELTAGGAGTAHTVV